MFVSFIFTIFCITFLRGLLKHIENKNQLARSNFAGLIMVNLSLTKTQKKEGAPTSVP